MRRRPWWSRTLRLWWPEVNERDLLTVGFEEHRPHLRRVAYRMLGSVDEADDAVQETWLRLNRTDRSAVENLGGWLTTVVGRICLDMLRQRRSHGETPVDSWLPEPIVALEGAASPEEEALIADGVGLALLVVLETLTPAERLAFVLHDMFAMPFDEIARIAGRSPEATRQLASRARRRVQGATVEPDVDLAEQRRVVDVFLEAARKGDFDSLLELLDPEVTLRVDAGPGSPLAHEPIVGADAVLAEARRWTAFAPHGRPAIVNGVAGAVIARPGQPPFSVVAFTIANGRVTALDFIVDPAKLARVTMP
jgi:RNA polymerase sigma-70 factor, ECF subfamily